MKPLDFIRRMMRERWKHCECDRTLSEWFVKYDERARKSVMYCYGGCGRLSEFANHRDD
jgi:hypothetical protein